jgi:uncharacterized protein YbcI
MAPGFNPSGEVLASISSEMVRIKSQHYGRGPTEAKTYVCDNFLLSALKGGLTKVEETLKTTGDKDLVREVRMRFQDQMAPAFTEPVERLTGHKVLAFQSQITFDPDYVFEIFVMDPDGSAADET